MQIILISIFSVFVTVCILFQCSLTNPNRNFQWQTYFYTFIQLILALNSHFHVVCLVLSCAAVLKTPQFHTFRFSVWPYSLHKLNVNQKRIKIHLVLSWMDTPLSCVCPIFYSSKYFMELDCHQYTFAFVYCSELNPGAASPSSN